MKEPEKPAEEVVAEGSEGAEAAATPGAADAEAGKEGEAVKKDDKGKATEKKQPEKK